MNDKTTETDNNVVDVSASYIETVTSHAENEIDVDALPRQRVNQVDVDEVDDVDAAVREPEGVLETSSSTGQQQQQDRQEIKALAKRWDQEDRRVKRDEKKARTTSITTVDHGHRISKKPGVVHGTSPGLNRDFPHEKFGRSAQGDAATAVAKEGPGLAHGKLPRAKFGSVTTRPAPAAMAQATTAVAKDSHGPGLSRFRAKFGSVARRPPPSMAQAQASDEDEESLPTTEVRHQDPVLSSASNPDSPGRTNSSAPDPAGEAQDDDDLNLVEASLVGDIPYAEVVSNGNATDPPSASAPRFLATKSGKLFCLGALFLVVLGAVATVGVLCGSTNLCNAGSNSGSDNNLDDEASTPTGMDANGSSSTNGGSEAFDSTTSPSTQQPTTLPPTMSPAVSPSSSPSTSPSASPSSSPSQIPVTLWNQSFPLDTTLWIDFSDEGLVGPIPTQVGLLTHLQSLNLFGNQLSGTLPAQLLQLSSARTLWLSRNALTGTLPTWLGVMTSLTGLGLWSNDFSGTIPTQVGLLTKLKDLHLVGNDLSGILPSELGLLTSLTDLGIHSNNRISRSSVPPEVCALPLNQFEGEVLETCL